MSKANKQDIKNAVEALPQSVLQRLFRFIQSLREPQKHKLQIKTVSLKGRFDDVNIRSRAYD